MSDTTTPTTRNRTAKPASKPTEIVSAPVVAAPTNPGTSAPDTAAAPELGEPVFAFYNDGKSWPIRGEHAVVTGRSFNPDCCHITVFRHPHAAGQSVIPLADVKLLTGDVPSFADDGSVQGIVLAGWFVVRRHRLDDGFPSLPLGNPAGTSGNIRRNRVL